MNYEEFLFHFKDYHDTVGDVPLNLLSTSLALNAYMLTGEEKYRDWKLEDVAALVESMTDETVTVSSVNLNPAEARPVVIQAGGYAEHRFIAVNYNDNRIPVDGTSSQIFLEPGSGTTLEIEMQRFVNQPTMDFPWYRNH